MSLAALIKQALSHIPNPPTHPADISAYYQLPKWVALLNSCYVEPSC